MSLLVKVLLIGHKVWPNKYITLQYGYFWCVWLQLVSRYWNDSSATWNNNYVHYKCSDTFLNLLPLQKWKLCRWAYNWSFSPLPDWNKESTLEKYNVIVQGSEQNKQTGLYVNHVSHIVIGHIKCLYWPWLWSAIIRQHTAWSTLLLLEYRGKFTWTSSSCVMAIQYDSDKTRNGTRNRTKNGHIRHW